MYPLLSAFLIFGVATSATAALLPNYVGQWRSEGCETVQTDGAPFGRKTSYSFRKDGTLRAEFLYFVDPKCETLDTKLVMIGHYKIGSASSRVAGAKEWTFTHTTATVTPFTAGAVELLNRSGPGTCGKSAWKIGFVQDIMRTGGCAILKVELKGCPVEYDIVQVSNDSLRIGKEQVDGLACTPERRPTELSPFSLIRDKTAP